MFDIVQCLRYISYTRSFGSWLCSLLQVIGYHYTDTYVLLVTTVDNGLNWLKFQFTGGLCDDGDESADFRATGDFVNS
jgi:hypothetical protein